jgi:TRAP-type C4-dicarboxylate transport system substrate-binding protein
MQGTSRRAFIRTAALGSAAAALSGSGAQAQGRTSLRATHFVPETSRMYQLSAGPFERALSAITDGGFTV